MADEPNTGTATPPAAPPPPTPKWFEGKVDAETIGHIQNRGWHDKAPEIVAIEAIKAHREAEKYIGVPADQVIRLPKDPADAKAWDAVWARLGSIKDGEKVDYANIKHADGSPLDAQLADLATGLAHRTHATRDGAIILAQELAKFLDGRKANELADQTAALAKEKDALAQNWGANANVNAVVATNAAKALGVRPEEVNALEKVIGYSRVMEMFRQIGTRIGEDSFVRGQGATSGGVMTVEQARAEIVTLKNDPEWVKRWLNGGRAEAKQFENLTRIIAGGARTA
ncbi:MAG: hypothetical protein JO110_25820 [Acetobacteraceae bacterium]|nr:hypothetical protein [Acetobacteraceae bacterium]